MRKEKRQNGRAGGMPSPAGSVGNFISGLWFTLLGAWLAGRRGGKSGMPTHRQSEDGEVVEQKSFYEEQNNEWHRRKRRAVEGWAAIERNSLETTKRVIELTLAPLVARLPLAERELKDADTEWREYFQKYGFSAWTVGLIAQQVGFFIIEIPLNTMAFSTKGDGRLLSFSAVIGLSMTVPFAAHTIGKRFKKKGLHSKIFASVFLALLFLLLGCVAVFRLEAFRQLANSHAALAGMHDWAVPVFYLALQAAFACFIIERSYSLANTLDEEQRAHYKFTRVRRRHALKDLTKIRQVVLRLEQALERLAGALKRLDEQSDLKVAQIESHRLSVQSVYRHNVALKRKDKGSIPPSWLEEPTANRARVTERGDYGVNGNGYHAARAGARTGWERKEFD